MTTGAQGRIAPFDLEVGHVEPGSCQAPRGIQPDADLSGIFVASNLYFINNRMASVSKVYPVSPPTAARSVSSRSHYLHVVDGSRPEVSVRKRCVDRGSAV